MYTSSTCIRTRKTTSEWKIVSLVSELIAECVNYSTVTRYISFNFLVKSFRDKKHDTVVIRRLVTRAMFFAKPLGGTPSSPILGTRRLVISTHGINRRGHAAIGFATFFCKRDRQRCQLFWGPSTFPNFSRGRNWGLKSLLYLLADVRTRVAISRQPLNTASSCTTEQSTPVASVYNAPTAASDQCGAAT